MTTPEPHRRPGRRHRPVAPLLAVLGATAIAFALPACGDDGGAQVASLVQGEGTHQPATPEEVTGGSFTVRAVATDLYGPIADAAGDANIAYSPLSITTVLAMVRTGADGESATQLDELLGTPGGDATAAGREVDGIAGSIQDLTGPVQLDDGEMGEIELTNANAMWGQSGVEWQQPFLDDLKTTYDTGMWTVDYVEDHEGARREINDWVAEHTREHITDLLPEGSITDLTRLTLTNAVWFKAPWPDELDDAGEQPFTTAAGDEVDASMLTTSGQYAYAEGDGWRAASLPYAGNDLAMTFIVPDAGKLAQVEAALPDVLLAAVSGASAPVNLTFPKFDIDQKAALGDALKGLGVTAPFETDTDFEPMTTDPAAQPLHLDDVLHQATVTVDEHGTEASAATGATFETVGAMLPDQELIVDRAFLFVVHDVATGTPLFLGRVADPTVK